MTDVFLVISNMHNNEANIFFILFLLLASVWSNSVQEWLKCSNRWQQFRSWEFDLHPLAIGMIWSNSYMTSWVTDSKLCRWTQPLHPQSALTPERCGLCVEPFPVYTLYTNDCTSASPVITSLKYSDDTAILAPLTDNHSALEYHDTVAHFTQSGARITIRTSMSAKQRK